jgi:hypothetical protein
VVWGLAVALVLVASLAVAAEKPAPANPAGAKAAPTKAAPAAGAPARVAPAAIVPAKPAAGMPVRLSMPAKPIPAKPVPAYLMPSKPAVSPAAAKPAAVTASAAGPMLTEPSGSAPAVVVKEPAPTPAAAPVPAGTTPPDTHLDQTYVYQYNALGRRDPFQSLVAGEFVGADVGGNAPPDVGSLRIVGIVWGDADHFALAEDARGNSYVLRQGDKVMNGFVEGIRRDAVIVRSVAQDESQTVTLPLQKGESNANR